MNASSVGRYGPVIDPWLAQRPEMPLGRGQMGFALKAQRETATVEHAFAHTLVRDPLMARAALAGLWLTYNDLDTSHTISQSIDTPTGSYWHGIMHRREGDFSNAKYWFRKVGSHPVFADLRPRAAELARNAPSHETMMFLEGLSQWDPFAFVDFVEQCVRGQSPSSALALAIQRCEWELLFDFCYREAVGGA